MQLKKIIECCHNEMVFLNWRSTLFKEWLRKFKFKDEKNYKILHKSALQQWSYDNEYQNLANNLYVHSQKIHHWALWL